MKALPKIVRWQLRKAAPASLLPHPDADQLTAFLELSLPHGERTAVLGHLSECSECRRVVALAERPEAMPSVTVRTVPRWRPVLAWGGMAAGVVIVAALFFLSHANQTKELAQAVASQRAAAAENLPGAISPATGQMNTAENTRGPRASAGTTIDSSQGVPTGMGSNELAPKKSAKVVDHPAASSDAARDFLPQGAQTVGAEKDESAGATSRGLGSGAISSNRQGARQSDNAAATYAGEMRESFAPSSPDTAKQTSRIDDRYPRWTLNSDGTLLRSLDTGASWQKISIPGNAALLHSIATVGAEVWVGGASGALYHSADEGGHWMQVNPTIGGKLLADDIISIEFATAQRGKFITSKQEVWTTADGGQTWTKE